MDSIFPIGFPAATILYLVLYVVTWVIHVAFMNYVLAGSGYLAVVSLFTGGIQQRQRAPLALVLRDWMPFMLSAAITAGVAPLLFVQILYKHQFYTANLLRSHRWMLILPVLIVAFYLCYLLKSKRIGTWPVWLRLIVGILPFLAFMFVAWSWSANYLVSVGSIDTWTAVYTGSAAGYDSAGLAARLAVWLASSIPTMVLFVSWQLWYQQRAGLTEGWTEAKRCSRIALTGIAATALACGWYYLSAGLGVREAIFSPASRLYAVLFLIGYGIQIVAWLGQWRHERLTTGGLSVATAGCAVGLIGVAVVRESIRLHAVDIASLYDEHAEALEVGGFPVFLAFFVIAGLLCAWCFVLVRRNQIPPSQRETSSGSPSAAVGDRH